MERVSSYAGMLGAIMLVGIVLVGVTLGGCHDDTTGDGTSGDESTRVVGIGPAAPGQDACRGGDVEAKRHAAVRRARRWLDLVEYAPATLGRQPALAILSYPDGAGADEPASLARRSYVYDDALALLWFTWTGQQARAAGLAETLLYLQQPDGAWGFSFATDADTADYDHYVRSGTVAWAAHALGYFGQRYGRPRAIRAAKRAARWLREMRLGGRGVDRGLVSAGRGRPSRAARADQPLPFAISEHQFDAHMVLASYEPEAAERLAERIMQVLWLEADGRFAVAASADGVNEARALDAAGAWGALWLLSVGERARAGRSFEFAREHFATDRAGLFGFRPYEDAVDGYDPGAQPGHVFVEGTMSMGLAAARLGDEQTAARVLATGVALSCATPGGVPYSNVALPGFSTRPAAASTLWFLFLEREIATGMRAPLFDVGTGDFSG